MGSDSLRQQLKEALRDGLDGEWFERNGADAARLADALVEDDLWPLVASWLAAAQRETAEAIAQTLEASATRQVREGWDEGWNCGMLAGAALAREIGEQQ